MESIKEKYNKEVLPKMKEKFGYTNNLAVPKILKVVVSSGIGSVKDNNKKEMIEKSLIAITGQKPVGNPAKQSIASFKLREGTVIGYSVILRGKRMYDFLEKLIYVTIPRIRDFRGLDPKIIDETGNMTIGFKEHIVFPEVSDHDVRETFGLGVTITTDAKTKEEALGLLKFIGFPIK